MSEVKLEQRITTPFITMEEVNKSTKRIVSRTDYTKVTSAVRNKIWFDVTVSAGNYENIHSIKLRFRQQNLASGNAVVYESNSSYVDSTTKLPLDYVIEDGVIYREVDLTTIFSNGYGTKYFSILTSGICLYTPQAASEYRPKLIIEVIPELDYMKHQISIEGSIKDDLYSIDVRTGKLNYTKKLLDVKTPLSMISLGMSYNLNYKNTKTLSTGINTGLGKGFKFNYQQYVYKSGNDYIYLDGNYLKHTFKPAINASSTGNQLYYDSLGTYMVLEETSSNVVIENDKTKLYFNSLGLLTSINTSISSNNSYVETIEYNSDNTIKKISNGSYYIEISYTDTLVTLTTNDGRINKIHINNEYLTGITDERNKVESYNYYNTSTLNKISFETNSVGFTFKSNYKIETIIKKYGSNIIEKNVLSYVRDRTKVETSKYPTNDVDNLKVTNVFIFDERGYNTISFEEESEKIGSIKQYVIEESVNKVIELNSGLEKHLNTLTSLTDPIQFNSVEPGDYTLSLGYKVRRTNSNDLTNQSETIKAELSINETKTKEVNLDFPHEEFKFINFEIDLTTTSNIKLELTNNLNNTDLVISGIVLSPKKQGEYMNLTTLPSSQRTLSVNNIDYYIDELKLVLPDGTQENMGFDDIIKTQKSMYQDNVKKGWFNNGKGMVYNINYVNVTNEVTTKDIKTIKPVKAHRKSVFSNEKIENIDSFLLSSVINLSEIWHDSRNTYVKKINYSMANDGNSSRFLNEVLETYDFYGCLLTKEQNSKVNNQSMNDDYKKTETYFYNANNVITGKRLQYGQDKIDETYGYDNLGNLNYFFDNKNAYSYVNNILGNTNQVVRNGTIISNNEYDVDLKTFKRTYMVNNASTLENKVLYNSDNSIDQITNNNLNYDYEYDEYGRLKNVKLNNVNIVTYDYSVSLNYYEIIVTLNDGQKSKCTYDKYGRLICYYEYNTENLEFEEYVKYVYKEYDGLAFSDSKVDYKELLEYEYRQVYHYNILGEIEMIEDLLYDIVTTKFNADEYHSEEEKYNYSRKLINFTTEPVKITEDLYSKFEVNNKQLDKKELEWKKEVNDNVEIKYEVTEANEYDGINRRVNNEILSGDILYKKSYNYYFANNSETNYIQSEVFKKGNAINVGNLPTISTTTYEYTNDLICKVTKDDYVETYSYDSLDRISSYSKTEDGTTKTQNFSYDDNGNIYIDGRNMQYNGQRLTSYNGLSIAYDNNGNITSIGTNTLSFEKNRLIEYNKGNTNVTFSYDPEGKRTSKTVNNTSRRLYYYENNRLIRERIEDLINNTNKDIYYLYGVNGLIGFIYDDVKYIYKRNIFGDVEEILNPTGDVVAKYDYDVFGYPTITLDTIFIASLNPIRYRGYYYDDETGLFWCNSRYYNPEWGRWISPDSIEYLDPSSINGLNLYAYCGNDPVNYTDRSGHSPDSVWKTLLGVAVGIGLAVVTVAAVVASGGTLLVPVLVGAGIGAGINLASQGISNLKNEKGLFEDINWGNVILGGLSGAAFATGVGGFWGAVGIGAASNAGMSALEGNSWLNIGISAGVGAIAASLGYGAGKFMSKYIFKNNGFTFTDYYETALLDFGKKTAFLIAAGTVGYTFLPTITTGITRGISNFIGNWIGDRF